MGKPRIPMRLFSPAVAKGLTIAEMDKLEQLPEKEMLGRQGCRGGILEEAVPQHDPTASEKVFFRPDVNAWIVLGRDRVTSKETGYGGNCRPQAGSIDIVVGKKGYDYPKYRSHRGNLLAHPDPELDAARIYISQKTDIDDNFNLARGNVGYSRGGRSGIIIKADAVRLHAREGLKLITGCAFKNERNSRGGDIVSFTGIDIIAGNKDSLLEPMVKGYLLTECLQELGSIVRDLASQSHQSSILWLQLWTVLGFHTHPYLAGLVAPDPLLLASFGSGLFQSFIGVMVPSVVSMFNLAFWDTNYLQPFGGKYINSKWNNVN